LLALNYDIVKAHGGEIKVEAPVCRSGSAGGERSGRPACRTGMNKVYYSNTD